MLQEINTLRENNRRLNKHWFCTREMDLFIWLRNGEPGRFIYAHLMAYPPATSQHNATGKDRPAAS